MTQYEPTPPTSGDGKRRGRKPRGEYPLTGAERQARYRRRQAGNRAAAPLRPPRSIRYPSRPQQWHAAVATLVALQSEYAAWLDASLLAVAVARSRRGLWWQPRIRAAGLSRCLKLWALPLGWKDSLHGDLPLECTYFFTQHDTLPGCCREGCAAPASFASAPLPSRACARPRNWAISLNTVSTLFPARRAWRTIYRQTARAQNGPACPDPLPLIQVSHKAT